MLSRFTTGKKPGVCVRALALPMAAIALASFAAVAAAATVIVFGPQTFTRSTGAPALVHRTFTVTNPAPTYTLRVTNHGVTSGDVVLNGRVVVDTDDLHRKYNRRDDRSWDLGDLWEQHRHHDDDDASDVVTTIDRRVPLRNGANDLLVRLAGKPGTSLTIEIFTTATATDTTPPVITASASPAPNANGWNNTDVTITFACSDAGSGVASCPAPITVTAEGANQTISGTATDNAGNHATATAHVSLDKTAPVVTATRAPSANANGWNSGPVTVHFTCADSGSGVASCPADQIDSSEGVQAISGTVTDLAGNTATATTAPIQIDLSQPLIAASVSPPPNANGWNNGPVTVHFTCTDAGAGVALCPADQVVVTDGLNQPISGTA